jgi:thioredoxin 1
MADVPKLTDSDFKTQVQSAEHPILVDFSATWCQPCKALAPTIEKVAEEYDGRLNVYNVDVEEAPEVAGEYGIVGVPTCILFKSGKEVDRFQGNQDINAIRERVEKVL